MRSLWLQTLREYSRCCNVYGALLGRFDFPVSYREYHRGPGGYHLGDAPPAEDIELRDEIEPFIRIGGKLY